MNPCSDKVIQLMPLLSEDEEPLLQESGAELIVGVIRPTNVVFPRSGVVEPPCEQQM
jgi:hypothetical protein